MEREVGGGIGMGNTCKPMAVSFQCMTKFTTNKKKFLNKTNKQKNKTIPVPAPLTCCIISHSTCHFLEYTQFTSLHSLSVSSHEGQRVGTGRC